MLPFLAQELYNQCHSIMSRFEKFDIISDVNCISNLFKVDFAVFENWKDDKTIDVGFVAEK